MSRKYKNVWMVLSYIEYFLSLTSANTGCISSSAFAYFFGIPLGITSSEIALKTCSTAAGTKKKQVNN